MIVYPYSCFSYPHAKLTFPTPHYNYCQFWPAMLRTTFLHYLTKDAVFGGEWNIFNVKGAILIFSTISKHFPNRRRIIK